MAKNYIEEKTFDGVDFTETALERGEYENCLFRNCSFSGVNLSELHFVECKFVDCDMSMAKLTGTALRTIFFKGCKLLGLHFEDCNEFLFAVEFENCLLNHSSFFKLKMKKTIFRQSDLQHTDFTEADLTNAVFDKCNLYKAQFDRSILERTDFTTAENYSIDPVANKIKKAKFSIPGVIGLLDRYDIEIV